MARIHHNTLKKAATHKLIVTDHGSKFTVALINDPNHVIAEAADPKDALELAILEITPVVVKTSKATKKPRKAHNEDGEDGEDGDNSKSVVKAKYKVKYRPHKMTCGDALAQQVRDRFMTQKDEDTGRPRLDFNAFVAFARANECWVEGYRSLKDKHGNRNNGMIRMNVVNRLRAKVKAGHKVV